MPLDKYFDEIESLGFQIQFSVVGGLKILQSSMAQHSTLVRLISEMVADPARSKAVHDRIARLLAKVDTETQLSYDESIAAYLFCLSKVDLMIAEQASLSILEHGGLWWSVQLAKFIVATVESEAV